MPPRLNLAPDHLDRMRVTMDPPADEAVRALYDGGDGSLTAINELFDYLIRNDQGLPESMPQQVRDFFEGGTLPDWARVDRIERAQEVFMTFGATCSTLLFCASLPACYLDRGGCEVLESTQRLQEHTWRRIWETSRWVVEVMREGGLTDPQRSGAMLCRRVRLYHAAIRHLLLTEAPTEVPAGCPHYGGVLLQEDWGSHRLGQPINQEDMGLALQTFCTVIGRGMLQLNIKLTTQELDDWVHCWSVIGHLMGVDDSLLPADWAEAERALETIGTRRNGESEAGKDLTRALINLMESVLPPGFGQIPEMLIYIFLGNEDARRLGVTLSGPERLAAKALEGYFKVLGTIHDRLEDNKLAGEAFQAIFLLIIKGVWRVDRGWERGLTDLPAFIDEPPT